jgi:hypothetical protein
MGIFIHFWASVQRRPFRVFLEEAHGLDILHHISHQVHHRRKLTTDILLVSGEAMIDACRQDNQVILFQPDAYPIVPFAPHIEESLAVENISDLLVLMQMLVEKHFDLVFIHITHFLG